MRSSRRPQMRMDPSPEGTSELRVVVVAEYYPRRVASHLGIWAHRQALAAREAGAEIRVLVLPRVIPPRAALERARLSAMLAPLRQPLWDDVDGLRVWYLPFI